MPPYGVSITKSVLWRGQAEEFSNVYHYDTGEPISSEDFMNGLIDAVVAQEKQGHSDKVTFLRARLYGPTDQGPAANKMLMVKDLSGAGTQAVSADIPFEMAVVCQYYVGRGPAGGKQFIRKYYHQCGLAGITANSPPQLGNAALPVNAKSNAQAMLTNLKNITINGINVPICTPKGKHLPLLSGDAEVLDHLHTRQFRR